MEKTRADFACERDDCQIGQEASKEFETVIEVGRYGGKRQLATLHCRRHLRQADVQASEVGRPRGQACRQADAGKEPLAAVAEGSPQGNESGSH